MDYDKKCKAAATNQGLDPVLEALAGTKGLGLAQTGGFCMAVTVSHDEGVWAIVNEGGFFATWFPGTTWNDGPAEDGIEREPESLEALVKLVSKPA